MKQFKEFHDHLDEDQVDELARSMLDGWPETLNEIECKECARRVSKHGRCLSLARLLARDTRSPYGRPAVEAVRNIRRGSYRRRVVGEIASVLTTSPLRTR